MAINLGTAFTRTSAEPIDNSQVLSKAEMIAMNDDLMPEKYFAVCSDDGKMYVYDKSATPSAETGKYSVVEGGSGDTGHMELTQAEYDALTDEQKNNGTVYFITDAAGGSGGGGISSGWGVAKIGEVTGTFSGDWLQGAFVDISDLGFTSIDEYDVYVRGVSNGAAQIMPYINAGRTATGFQVAANRNGQSVTEFTVSYVVVARGYGAGWETPPYLATANWGVAKTGSVTLTSNNGSHIPFQLIDITDLGLSSVDDYEVFVTVEGNRSTNYKVEEAFAEKISATQFEVAFYTPSQDGLTVNLSYIVIAKGFCVATSASRGEENTIESVSVNGTAVTPDVNKNVNIVIDHPVDSISVNGTAVAPDQNGNVNIEIDHPVESISVNNTAVNPDANGNVNIPVPNDLGSLIPMSLAVLNGKAIRVQGVPSGVGGIPDTKALLSYDEISYGIGYWEGARNASNEEDATRRDASGKIKINSYGFSMEMSQWVDHRNLLTNEEWETDRKESVFSITFDPYEINSTSNNIQVTMSDDVRQAFRSALGLTP